MKKVFTALYLAFVLAGCATIGQAPRGEGPVSPLKKDPLGYEREAKETLRKIALAWTRGDTEELARWDPSGLVRRPDGGAVPPVSLDLAEEAVWFDQDTVSLRISWQRGTEQKTGSQAGRHMANFVFKAARPMTLVAIEGENPFQHNPH